MQFRYRSISTNGIKMHIAEAGSGPLVVMCTAFLNRGMRDAIRSSRWPRQACLPSLPISGVTVRRRALKP
jgi:hypothetical protein